MSTPKTKSSLSSSQQRFLEVLQQLNFGRVEGLRISCGEPVFEPVPRIIQKVKLGGENGPRPEHSSTDFFLKTPILEMFATFAEIGEGEVQSIEVKYGLPFSMEIAKTELRREVKTNG